MIHSLIAAIIGSVLISAALLRERSGRRMQIGTIASFGTPGGELTGKEASEVLRAYARQQSRAFALLWASVALLLVLASAAIGRIVFARVLDVQSIVALAGSGLDSILVAAARQLYLEASNRLESLLRELGTRSYPRATH